MKETDEWICGYAAAIAAYITIEDCVNAWLREVFQSGIGTVAKAEAAGVDEYDLKILRAHKKDLEQKR